MQSFISFLVTPQAKRALLISFPSLILVFFTGSLTMSGYVTDIFTKTGSSFGAKNSSLVMSFIQLTGNLVFLIIVERTNRRVSSCSQYLAATLPCHTNNVFFVFRHFTFGHHFWRRPVYYSLLRTVSCGWVNRSLNGCRRSALLVSFTSVVWGSCRFRL